MVDIVSGRAVTRYRRKTDTTEQASRTKESRAQTLLNMGGSLLREKWEPVWPVIRKPSDAGFAVPISLPIWHKQLIYLLIQAL